MKTANKKMETAKPVIKRTGNFGMNADKEFAVSVHLDSGGKVRDYLWNGVDLPVGATCVVEEKGALDIGKVTMSRRPTASSCCCKRAVGKVVRSANKGDMDRVSANARKEKSAMSYCRERIYEMDLKMSLARVKYSFDGKKALFYFTAESRVDFRALVKELANYTRARVEMRQVGVRDEAKQLGGCGPCGHELCCSMFLSDFAPVSIRMAKEQSLSLSPEKISGVCGRLMCCLAYEYPTYKELHKKAPRMGKTAQTPDGRTGKVCYLNLLQERVGIALEGGEKVEFNLSEMPGRGKGKRPEPPHGSPSTPAAAGATQVTAEKHPITDGAQASADPRKQAPAPRKRKRRREGGKTGDKVEQSATANEKAPAADNAGQDAKPGARRRRRRPRRSRGGSHPSQSDAG